jgi:hypothetical protein
MNKMATWRLKQSSLPLLVLLVLLLFHWRSSKQIIQANATRLEGRVCFQGVQNKLRQLGHFSLELGERLAVALQTRCQILSEIVVRTPRTSFFVFQFRVFLA